MPSAKLKFSGREMSVGSGMTTVGRTSDNGISFPDDSNVSRYHIEIESRDNDYWVKDLGSSNGTTVGGSRVDGEMLLKDGDEIVLGGSSRIEIEIVKEKSNTPGAGSITAPISVDSGETEVVDDRAESAEAIEEQRPSSRNKLLAAGAGVGLIAILAVGGIAYYATRGPSCPAIAVINDLEMGETIVGEKNIEVEINDEPKEGCVAGAILYVDDKQVATTKDIPVEFKLKTDDIPEFADGLAHYIYVVLFNDEGEMISSSKLTEVAFEARQVAKPDEEKPIVADNPGAGDQNAPNEKELSLIEISNMSKALLKQFSGNKSYNLGDQQFLKEVRKKTADYAVDGYYDRAAKYRDAINIAFVQENNLDASFGFILAMSRSKLDPAKQGGDEGLWRMKNEFVAANGYNGLCGTETLSDPSQNCAAKAAAIYLKAMVFGVFDGDMIYTTAAFGKSPADASIWRSALPANHTNVWTSIKTAQERENVVNFFAAGIVAENPQKFGLKDKPLSELYRLTL